MGEGACLETLTRATSHVGHADAFAPPDDSDGVVVRIVEDLDLQPVEWPLHRAYRIDDPLGDVTLVVDRDLYADFGLRADRDRCAPGRAEAGGAPGQVEQVRPEAQEREAAGREDPEGDRGDQLASGSSNSAYGRMVART